ncbi:fimbria/pilus periplasmic chaperone [Citrobacter freundii]|nr:fimbria/pilus periplasmic chaperone [Citrobacter freundii]
MMKSYSPVMRLPRKLMRTLAGFFILFGACSSTCLAAGGFGLGVTRLIYPAESTQVALNVQNGGEKNSYLIQSWVDESETNKKSQDFVVTPPLFMLPTRKAASLRIMFVGQKNLPTDRETLYWMNVKAIPPTDEQNTEKNTLQLALQNRIKLFYRPEHLSVQPGKAKDMLRFRFTGNQLKITNPSPYYITLTGIKMGNTKLPNSFIAPKSDAFVALAVPAGGEITFQTINDFGATTARQKATMQ